MRNLILTLFFVGAFSLISMQPLAAAPLQQTVGLSWSPALIDTQLITPGSTKQITATLRNTATTQVTVNLSSQVPAGWTVESISTGNTITLAANTGSQSIIFTIRAPAAASTVDTITITASPNPANAAIPPVSLPISVQAAVPTATSSTATFTWSPVSVSVNVLPGQTVGPANMTLQSTSPTGTTQNYVITSNIADNAGWALSIAPSTNVSITGSGNVPFAFFVTAPANASPGSSITIEVVATRASDNASIKGIIIANVTAPTLTPTRTITPTPTTGPICPEGNRDPGNDFGSAKLIVVDSPNNHGICEVGDEDWFKFAAIGGKVYTPDITRFDIGLDLSLELYDSDGNRLAFNDDYYARTPQPTAAGNAQTPLPTRDIGPRIQSWRAPKDGIYYVRVRDTANVGGGNRTYTFIIYSESYGPTPSTVAEICRDLFEEDGLPEEAKLITSNEIQRGHLLCPTGDADWVKFFGKTGKTYYIYTDTRPYRNNPSASPSNTETQAGADTVLYLFGRDGVSIITFNDDIEDSTGSSLDSQIRFVPQVDGFYFAQVKNIGDIGNQFIKYDIALTLCTPGRDNCGRSQVASTAPQPTVPPTSAPTQSPVALLTATATATPTPTATATPTTSTGGSGNDPQFLGQAVPSTLVDGPISGFADPAFESVWYRTDQVVASGQVNRSWLWGPQGRMARSESYVQVEGGLRQVQYFDKARMELSNPKGDRSSRWFVTTGLLVAEMVTGRIQIGDNEFVERTPAPMPVAGDENDSSSPSYASFRNVVTGAADDRSGQRVLEAIDGDGTVRHLKQAAPADVQLVHYVAETGHNIPQVFWNYMHMQGLVREGNRTRNDTVLDWVFTLGYPISEPYWMTIHVGGIERSVLVQLFQRRILTYNPANPSEWQVELGNVGRHYYRWRYGTDLPGDL